MESTRSLIDYRPFLNCDPPDLLRVWREQPADRGLMQPISHLLLELFVLSKPYFDRHGLIVAVDDGRVVGFAHGGFGPNQDGSQMSCAVGLVCLLLVAPHERRPEILCGLLGQVEDYLRRRGAKELRVGGAFPLSPFYLGLYGGSDLPGILRRDSEMNQFFREHGYEEFTRSYGYERNLAGDRLPVDRQALQQRRDYRLLAQVNPKSTNWWETCVFGPTDRIRFVLLKKPDDEMCGQITYWDMGPLATRPGSGGMGLIKLQIEPEMRRRGLAGFLACESLKQLQSSGTARVETQTLEDNPAGLRLLNRLGFKQIREGALYRKPA